MKILVDHVAKIEHAEVEIQGISVLAGYNATGKSTVSKSLNAIISAYTDVLERARDSRLRSMSKVFDDFLYKIFEDELFFTVLDNHELFLEEFLAEREKFPEEYESFRILAFPYLDVAEKLPVATPEIDREYDSFLKQLRKVQNRQMEEDIQFVIERSMLGAFDNQINTIGQTSLGRIALSDDNGAILCEVSLKGNRLQSCSYKGIKECNPIYLEPKHSLDGLPADGRTSRRSLPVEPLVSNLLAHDEEQTEWITIEVREKLDRISALINEAIHGGLVENGKSLQYMDEQASFISLKNLASGSKTFAVIKRLLENGQLYRNQTLIIDEPEVNLHPEWQLILAKVLVILYKELGLKVFLNSHSPYFIRAVEVCSKRYDIADHCFFYQTVPGENGLYQVEDVTTETEKIYQALYRPLEEL